MSDLKIGLFMGIAIGVFTANMIHIIANAYDNKIPKAKQVQQGFVIPNKLEIKLQDLDNDGKDEVLMIYGEKPYLLRLDEQGRPQVQEYEVKPAEIVPKE